jgi:hypothetical protein
VHGVEDSGLAILMPVAATLVRESGLSVSLQLPLAPMGVFAIGIEHPFDVAVQCSHDAKRANIAGPAACHS